MLRLHHTYKDNCIGEMQYGFFSSKVEKELPFYMIYSIILRQNLLIIMKESNVKRNTILSPIKIIIGLIVMVFLAFVVTLVISIYVGWNLTHPAHNKIVETPVKYNLKYDNINFNSQLDDVELKGWWIPAQKNNIITDSKKTVIFAHGYKDTRDLSKIHVLALAKRITQEGYNVMLFDFRNSGESGGEITSVGLFETYDMLSFSIL